MRRRVIRSPASGPDVMVEPGAGGLGDYVLSQSPAVEDPYGYLSRRALAYPMAHGHQHHYCGARGASEVGDDPAWVYRGLAARPSLGLRQMARSGQGINVSGLANIFYSMAAAGAMHRLLWGCVCFPPKRGVPERAACV